MKTNKKKDKPLFDLTTEVGRLKLEIAEEHRTERKNRKKRMEKFNIQRKRSHGRKAFGKNEKE